MNSLTKIAAVSILALGAGILPAMADACSGRSHDTGSALGAAGGAAIGGLATHSIGGAIIGGVAGGFAGNAIARSEDCNRHTSRSYRHHRNYRDSYYVDRHGRRHYR